jgi:hypothetical protein
VLGSEAVADDDALTDTAGTAPDSPDAEPETRYARPCLPVKPLLIIWEVRQMWTVHSEQRR